MNDLKQASHQKPFAGLRYFSHLGRLGLSDVHALGSHASAALVHTLQLADGMRVLEIGFGTGATLARVAQIRQVQLVGMDFSTGMHAAATQRLKMAGVTAHVQLIRAHLNALPLRAGFLDRAYSESALCFHAEPTATAALHAIQRALKPGGVFVANEAIWKDDAPDAQIRHACERALQDFGSCQSWPQGWRLGDWINVMQRAGFEVNVTPLSEACATAPAMTRNRWVTSRFGWQSALRRVFDPALKAERAHYESLYKNHRGEGALTEDWLFVLKR